MLNAELAGPISPQTFWEENYYITLTESFKEFTLVRMLKLKSETFEALTEMILQMDARRNLKTHSLRCDRGGEYTSTKLKSWCSTKGIVLDYSPPDVPQLDGTSERKNGVLMDRVSALLCESRADRRLWSQALYTACCILNRSPKRGMLETPFQNWFKRTPNLNR